MGEEHSMKVSELFEMIRSGWTYSKNLQKHLKVDSVYSEPDELSIPKLQV